MILNLGCGKEFVGDIRADITRSCSTNILCEATHLPFIDSCFDKVVSHNLMEHLPNPLLCLQEQKRTLKSGGEIELLTDNASYWRFHVLSKSAHIKYQGRSENDRHYVIYMPFHFKNYFDSLEMKIICLEFVRQKPYRITGAINVMLGAIPPLRHTSFSHILVLARK